MSTHAPTPLRRSRNRLFSWRHPSRRPKFSLPHEGGSVRGQKCVRPILLCRHQRSTQYPAGYSWVRIHFYPFCLTPEDLAAARAGNVQSLDKKVNKNSYDPKVRDNSYGIIQLSEDKDFKVWQVDMSVPGHSCTIAPLEKEVQSFLQAYHYDGKNLRLKSKGSYICDLRSVGAGQQTFTWNFDVSLPVFEKPVKK